MQQLNHLGIKLRKNAVASLNNRDVNVHVSQIFGELNADEAGTKNYSAFLTCVLNRGLYVICVGDVAQPECALDSRNIKSSRFSAG